MSILRRFLDNMGERLQSGGRLDRLYPLFEAKETFLFTPLNISTLMLGHIRPMRHANRYVSKPLVNRLLAIRTSALLKTYLYVIRRWFATHMHAVLRVINR